MAADSFTAADNTPLASHTAGGNTWAGCGQADAGGLIQGNVALADASEFFQVSARATNSTAGYSQIVFKAGAYGAESKAVHVRADGTQGGYWLQCYDAPTGDTFASLTLRKGDTFLSSAAVTMNRLVDNTLAIKATTSGSDVLIEAWLNGTQLTFNESLPGFEGPPSTVFTDTAANTPILTGNPGFTCGFFDGLSAANTGFDNWTDVQASGAAITGTGALTAAAATAAGTGTKTTPSAVTGTGALTAAAATGAGTGIRGSANTNSPALTAAVATAAGAGTVTPSVPQSVTGAGALTTTAEQVAGTGTRGVYDGGGDVEIAATTPTVSGTGTINAAGQNVTGTGALSALKPLVSGQYVPQEVTGTGALSANAPTISGTYVPKAVTGTGALNVQTPAVAGTNIVSSGGRGFGTRFFGLGLGVGL